MFVTRRKKMSSRSTIWAASLAAALAPGSAFALQPLEDFVKSSKNANFDARDAKALVAQRGAEVDVSIGKLLPTFTATGTYTRNQFKAESVRPDGTTIVITPEDQLDANFTLRVPLVDVGGWYKVSASKASEDAAKARLEATTTDLEASIAQGYYTLVGVTHLRDAAKKTLTAAEKNLEVVKLRREAERALELDVLRAEAEVARAKQTVAEAQQQVTNAGRNLETLTGLKPTEGVPALDPPKADELPRDAVEKGARDAPLVRAARADEKAASRARDAAWMALFPTVSATLNERLTNATGFAGKDAIFSLAVTATFSLDYSTFAQARVQDTMVAAAKVKTDRAERAQVDQALEANDRVGVQATKAKAAKAEEDAAQKAVALARDRLASGTGSVLEVVQAERDALSASANRIQAEADLAYARVLAKVKSGGAKKGGAP